MNLGQTAVAPAKENTPETDKRLTGNKNMNPKLPPRKPPDKNNNDLTVDGALELQRLCAELCGGER